MELFKSLDFVALSSSFLTHTTLGSFSLLLSDTWTLTIASLATTHSSYPSFLYISTSLVQHSFVMSHNSPQSSTGVGPSSSPYAGTDPTLYSPELTHYTRSAGLHHRNNLSQVTVTDNGKPSHQNAGAASPKYKGILPFPAPYYQGLFANEVSEDDKSFISRFQFISQLPDGTNAGVDSEHELFSVQHQMKLVGPDYLSQLTQTDHSSVSVLLQLRACVHPWSPPPLRRPS
jgi:hypothetical protein